MNWLRGLFLKLFGRTHLFSKTGTIELKPGIYTVRGQGGGGGSGGNGREYINTITVRPGDNITVTVGNKNERI